MSEKYKIFDDQLPYFITFTIVRWIDLFTRNEYRKIILDSLKYCQKNKGLIIYSYCIMTNHLHLIVKSSGHLNKQHSSRFSRLYIEATN